MTLRYSLREMARERRRHRHLGGDDRQLAGRGRFRIVLASPKFAALVFVPSLVHVPLSLADQDFSA